MSEYHGHSLWMAKVARPDNSIVLETETLVVQGGVAVATILSLAFLFFSLTRLVKAIRDD